MGISINVIEKKQREDINWVRLIANYMIVLYHAGAASQYVQHGTRELFVWRMIADVLVSVSLPALFLISGFLLMKSFSMEAFKDKFFRRVKRLFVPFVVWNLTFVVFYLSCARFVPRLSSRVASFGLNTLSGALSKTIGFMSAPIDGPLWFLRTILIYTLLAPMIWHGLKICKGVFVYLAVLAWWLLSIYLSLGERLISTYPVYSLVCFIVGAHLSFLKIEPFKLLVSRVARSVTLLIGLVGVILYCIYEYHFVYTYSSLRDISLILATPFLFVVVSFFNLCVRESQTLNFLIQSSFFIYAGHFLFCSMLLHAIAPLLNGIEFLGKQTLLVAIFFVGGAILSLSVYGVARRVLGRLFSLWDGTL